MFESHRGQFLPKQTGSDFQAGGIGRGLVKFRRKFHTIEYSLKLAHS